MPTLHGLHANRSFFHHGQVATLPEVFNYVGGTLRLPSSAQALFVPPTPPAQPAVVVFNDAAGEGGGGLIRGAFGGNMAYIGSNPGGSTELPGLRFNAVDGGAGGNGRLAIRYVRQYGPGTVQVRINGGTPVSHNVFRQIPDNSFHVSGWLWLTIDTPLLPGPNNVIEILRGTQDIYINALLVSTPADLAAAEPHRRVLQLSPAQRSDLYAYLGQLDGRDAAGVPLAPPTPPAPTAPTIVSNPAGRTIAVGNAFSLTVAIAGSGPFTYQWFHGPTPVGPNSATFGISSATLGLSLIHI